MSRAGAGIARVWAAPHYAHPVSRYRLSIAYDGTEFVGWQKQAPATPIEVPAEESGVPIQAPEPLRSVQGVVERAIREVVRQPVILIGASRTDSGVHAQRQTGAFTSEDSFRSDGRRIGPPDDRMQEAINSRLPPDVLVTSCAVTDPFFDPIKDCLCKGYRYSLWVSRDRPLWERGRVWHHRSEMDHAAMDRAARHFVGTHDFTSMAAVGHGRESAVRSVLRCAVSRPQPERIEIDISADGFLWNMVRIIAGTLAEVGRGRLAEDDVPAILAALDRERAGPTAPAHGLCLMWGLYPGDASPDAASGIDGAWLAARERLVLGRRAERAARAANPIAAAEAPPDGGQP